MRKYDHDTSQEVPFECPCCRQLFECAASLLTGGSQIACPNCNYHFECSGRELFAAIRHLHKLVS